MPHFVRGLAEVGAEVLGVGDQPVGTLAPETRGALSDYLRVRSLWNEATLVEEVARWLAGRNLAPAPADLRSVVYHYRCRSPAAADLFLPSDL